MATDKWLRRLGVATFAVLAVGGALLGAPTILEISRSLVSASTEMITAPEPPPPPSSPRGPGAAPAEAPAAPEPESSGDSSSQ
jgi:hypothetical protein